MVVTENDNIDGKGAEIDLLIAIFFEKSLDTSRARMYIVVNGCAGKLDKVYFRFCQVKLFSFTEKNA